MYRATGQMTGFTASKKNRDWLKKNLKPALQCSEECCTPPENKTKLEVYIDKCDRESDEDIIGTKGISYTLGNGARGFEDHIEYTLKNFKQYQVLHTRRTTAAYTVFCTIAPRDTPR